MQPSANDNDIEVLRHNLRRGQILTALVKQHGKGNCWFLLLGGVTLPFDSCEQLIIGERIMLVVEKLKPTIQLKRIGAIKNGSIDSTW